MDPETGCRSSLGISTNKTQGPSSIPYSSNSLAHQSGWQKSFSPVCLFYLCYHLWFFSGLIASFMVRVAGSVLIHQPLKRTHRWQIKSNNSTLEGQRSIFIWIAMFFNRMWLYFCCFQFLMILILLPSVFPLIYYWDHLLIPHRHLVHIYWMVASAIMIDTLGIK